MMPWLVNNAMDDDAVAGVINNALKEESLKRG
jgi:hypothetical protein